MPVTGVGVGGDGGGGGGVCVCVLEELCKRLDLYDFSLN